MLSRSLQCAVGVVGTGFTLKVLLDNSSCSIDTRTYQTSNFQLPSRSILQQFNKSFPYCMVYADYAVSFDKKGFPAYSTPTAVSSKAQPLYLSGVGMRRKNLFVVEVDIYKVGLCLSEDALRKGKEAILAGKKVSEFLLDDEENTLKPVKDPVPSLSIPLVFVRSVTTSQVVDAFNDAFVGCDKNGIDSFKSILRDVIGANGMKVGDEITYYWLKGGGLVISKDGVCGMILRNKDIERRLLDVYVDPARTVSPDLVKCIEQNFRQ